MSDFYDELERVQFASRITAEKRDAQVRESFKDPDALADMIRKDACYLVSITADYGPPSDEAQREMWIQQMMHNDPVFHAKVKFAAEMIHEYVRIARGQ